MKILLLSEDNFILDDNSPKRAKILEFSSFASTLFVIILTTFEKDTNKIKQIAQNTWIYRVASHLKFLRIFNAINLASFEMKAGGVFQADVIISEDQFISTFTGYLLARKFKRPLYIFLSEENEKKLFAPRGFKRFLLSKILWFVLKRADFIKVDNQQVKEKLIKKSSSLSVEIIKPFIDPHSLIIDPEVISNKKTNERNLIKKKFAQLRFTSVVFVDNKKQAKIALNILEGLNKTFPPTSLIILISDDLSLRSVNRLVKENSKPFVCIESLNSDLIEYMAESNVFFGISSGGKYDEILSNACAIGSKVIALESETSKRLIEDNVTGFICPPSKEKETVDYFVNKTFFLMKNPVVGINFKVNLPLSFKQQFNTKEEYLNKLKSSLDECAENYKKSHIKHYEF